MWGEDVGEMTFRLERLYYKVGVKVYSGVLERLGIQNDLINGDL